MKLLPLHLQFVFSSGLLSFAATFAQVPPPPPRPIDQGIGDAGPLSTSLRQTQPGLRQPTGFDHVYPVPGRDDLLMRMDGGMVAVFPRSTYVRSGRGNIPTIPPGTVFYIGVPTHLAMGVPDRDGVLPGQQFRLGSRVAPRVDQMQVTQFSDNPQNGHGSLPDSSGLRSAAAGSMPTISNLDPLRPVVTTIVNDHAYRAQRVEQLMQQAANAVESQRRITKHQDQPQPAHD